MPALEGAVAINVYVVCYGFLVEKKEENAATGKFIEI